MFLAVLSVLSSQVLSANEKIPHYTDPGYEKIYVQPEDIYIQADGIFYKDLTGAVVPAQVVASDNFGIYIVAQRYQCPGCGRWNNDGVCWNILCPLYGQ